MNWTHDFSYNLELSNARFMHKEAIQEANFYNRPYTWLAQTFNEDKLPQEYQINQK